MSILGSPLNLAQFREDEKGLDIKQLVEQANLWMILSVSVESVSRSLNERRCFWPATRSFERQLENLQEPRQHSCCCPISTSMSIGLPLQQQPLSCKGVQHELRRSGPASPCSSSCGRLLSKPNDPSTLAIKT